ncbi:hypothetical protein I7I51_00898 [Histoplasma capsulatum]|uniref:Uncharacterized protein n=1 Tax=Ajellomyces capsulatus TaxID=5037 RepID=A0A8A1MBA2_AJECA|nr:hypothetical protein I7I51_00898 [Histoplasma capsulatum]
MFAHTHVAKYNSLSTGASQDHEEEYQDFRKSISSASNCLSIMESLDTVAQARRDIEQNIAHMDDLYSALLQMRQDIEENIGTLEEPLQHLSNAKTTGDIQKYLQEFSIEFHKLFLLFEKLAGFTSCALSIGAQSEAVKMPEETKMAQEVPPVVVDGSEPRLAAWRTREAPKNDAGQIYCDHPDCHDHIFKRRSEWTEQQMEVDVFLFRL